jgi:hypothetical protein
LIQVPRIMEEARRMNTRQFTALGLVLLFVFTLQYTRSVERAEGWSGGTITIKSDGSVSPVGAPIQRNGDFYMLTSDVYCNSGVDGIRINSGGITLDGAMHTLQGTIDMNTGLLLNYTSDVTIKNLRIDGFRSGIFVSSPNIYEHTGNVNIQKCSVVTTATTGEEDYRIVIQVNSKVTGCYIEGQYGLGILESNLVMDNTIISSGGVWMYLHLTEYDGAYNWIYRNNFIGLGDIL